MWNKIWQLKMKTRLLIIVVILVTVLLMGAIGIQESFAESNSQYNLLEKNTDDSPLKQFNLGIPIFEIQCKMNLVLTQKYDATPACVTPETLAKLIERGWVIKDFGNADAEPAILSGLQVDVTGQQQIRRGTTHDIAVDVTRDGYVVSDALVRITIEDYGKNVIRDFKGRTDDSGRFVFSWEIPKSFDDIKTLLAYVDVTDDISAKTILFKFQVYCLPGETRCKVEGN